MSLKNGNYRRVVAVVLAAGHSRRFGTTKQLAEFAGESLVQRAVRHAANACDDKVAVVVGHDAEAVTDSVANHNARIIHNEQPERGLSSSLQVAVAELTAEADALLIVLADQVLVTDTHLRALIAKWDGNSQHIVASRYNDTLGAPALIPAGCFEATGNLRGDAGARALFKHPEFVVSEVPCDVAAVDIDTVADLQALN